MKWSSLLSTYNMADLNAHVLHVQDGGLSGNSELIMKIRAISSAMSHGTGVEAIKEPMAFSQRLRSFAAQNEMHAPNHRAIKR